VSSILVKQSTPDCSKPKKGQSPVQVVTNGIKSLLKGPKDKKSEESRFKRSKDQASRITRAQSPYDKLLSPTYPKQRAPLPEQTPLKTEELESEWGVTWTVQFDRHHPRYDAPIKPKPALLVNGPEDDDNKRIYWSSFDCERYEKNIRI
jgi:hypothetical protein